MDLVKVAEPRTVQITWERARPEKCGDGIHVIACARYTWDFTRCRITADEDAPDHVLAHEFRHCFGWVHKRHEAEARQKHEEAVARKRK
jgi:hypothetical protein